MPKSIWSTGLGATAVLAGCARAVSPANGIADDASLGHARDGSTLADTEVQIDIPLVEDGGPIGEGGVAEGLPVAQLSLEQAREWCTWWSRTYQLVVHQGHLDTPEYVATMISGPDTRGFRHYAYGAACLGGTSFLNTPEVIVDDCVTSLRLRPCAATIAQVERCVTAISGMLPVSGQASCDTAVVECGALARTPGCQDVLMTPRLAAATHWAFLLRVRLE
jgi:hypothetical protein